MARRTKLTPEMQQVIVQYIRAGAYDWVAAQAAGIHPSTFRRWMARGENRDRAYRAFYDDVRQARAEARAAAEVEVRRDNPLAWLRYGPGRERPEESGWTQSVQHEHAGPAGEAIPVEFITRLVEEDRHDAHKA